MRELLAARRRARARASCARRAAPRRAPACPRAAPCSAAAAALATRSPARRACLRAAVAGQRLDAAHAGGDAALSPTIVTRPMSPVRRTWVPPHSSTEQPSVLPRRRSPIETTRTSSPYFSPNSARAPDARGVVERHQPRRRPARSAARCRWRCPRRARAPRRVIGLGWEKSKRSRSGATSEPFCATWSPSTWRSASCSRCVAEWLARMRGAARVVDLERDRVADLQRALARPCRDGRTGRRPSSACR